MSGIQSLTTEDGILLGQLTLARERGKALTIPSPSHALVSPLGVGTCFLPQICVGMLMLPMMYFPQVRLRTLS